MRLRCEAAKAARIRKASHRPTGCLNFFCPSEQQQLQVFSSWHLAVQEQALLQKFLSQLHSAETILMAPFR